MERDSYIEPGEPWPRPELIVDSAPGRATFVRPAFVPLHTREQDAQGHHQPREHLVAVAHVVSVSAAPTAKGWNASVMLTDGRCLLVEESYEDVVKLLNGNGASRKAAKGAKDGEGKEAAGMDGVHRRSTPLDGTPMCPGGA